MAVWEPRCVFYTGICQSAVSQMSLTMTLTMSFTGVRETCRLFFTALVVDGISVPDFHFYLRHPDHSHNLPLSKSLTQPYRKNVQTGLSTPRHLNRLLNPPVGAVDMFCQSDCCGQIRPLPRMVRCPKSPEIQHF